MHTMPTLDQILALHENALSAGGPTGVRDMNAIEGALEGTLTTLYYTPDMSVGQTAATLAWRLSKAHGFVDGNKRSSALAFTLVLALNGWHYTGTAEDLASAIIEGAASKNGLPDTFEVLVQTKTQTNPTTQLLMDYDQGIWSPTD